MYRSDDLARSIEPLKPDHRMRSGPDLAKQYDVSVVTIQRAFDGLRPEGTVVAVAGARAAGHQPKPRHVRRVCGDHWSSSFGCMSICGRPTSA
jgi:DNA-binding transcriptional MocR family regulator